NTGLAVILDVVYNHLGAEGNYLGDFGPYFTDRYRTAWGEAFNYDGPGSDEVRRYVVDNALYWITEYHIDGLRLDAVHQIYDRSATNLLQEMATAVHQQAERLDRRALVIAESDLNDPRLIRPVEQGGYGLDAQWSDDFHHAVHAELTGERNGYYADFLGLEDVATALASRFVYTGQHSGYRRRRHGAPAATIPADRFVIAIQNHDQIGNRAAGERLSVLLSLNQQKLAAALLLLSPYVPLMFMGQEYGETHPFLYFISHEDPELIEAVRRGRREEFAAFGWTGEVPDPADPETFERSLPDRLIATAQGHAGLLALYTDLLALRRSEPALRPGDAAVSVMFDASAGWISLRLTPEDAAELLVLFNFDRQHAEARVPLSEPGTWHLVLATDDRRYEGQGMFGYDGAVVTMAGAGAALFRG
ncbi:MAG TPA: alpha-amylase family glycosyl hydrolase, partial [Gemmatimonadales bacterium]|nr:alpha-amylase family glycosyl hydrolase [Gemmatimonadales bacterium]